jgi:hypothetical protein
MSRNRLSWSDSVLLAVATALPTAVLAGRMLLDWRYPSWTETTRVLSATLIAILPVVTLAVVLVVGRTKRRAAQTGTPIRPPAFRSAVAAVVAGWMAGAAPVLIWTIRVAGDEPRLVFLLVPAAWVAAITTAAATLALTFRQRTALLAVGAFWVAAVGADRLTGQNSRWLLFLPFSGMSGQPSGEVVMNSWLAAVRLFVAAAIVMAAVFLQQPDRPRRRTVGWAAVGVVAASVVFPVPVYAAATPQVVCLDGGTRVCLLAEHRQDLAAVRAIVDRTAAEAGPALFPFTLASETAENGPTSLQLAVGPQRKASIARDVAGELAGKIARIDRCFPESGQRVDPAYRLIAFWFVEKSGLPLSEYAQDPALELRLTGWRQRPVEITATLRALAGRLDACTLTIDQLPPAGPASAR